MFLCPESGMHSMSCRVGFPTGAVSCHQLSFSQLSIHSNSIRSSPCYRVWTVYCWSGVGRQHLQEPAGERGEVQEAGTDLWQSWRPCWIGHIGLANKYLIVAPNPIMKCSATHSSTIVWRNQGTLEPLEYLFFSSSDASNCQSQLLF